MSVNASPFRWAVLGTGAVSHKFCLGLQAAPGHEVVTVASRNPANAARFSDATGVSAAAGYAEAAAMASVDAVYVATPPSEHEAHAGLAIDAGKPVLVEKPFAIDAEAAARIRSKAEAADVFCMEAMWTRFLPLLDVIRRDVEAGGLGEPQAFVGGFTGTDAPDPGASLFDPLRGGGALMHRGIYPLSLARHLLGPVTELQATARIGNTGVDETVAITLSHQSGAISSITAGLRAAGTNRATLYGTKATIEIGAPIYRPFSAQRLALDPRVGSAPGSGRLAALKEGSAAQRLNQRLTRLKTFVKPSGQTIVAPFAGNGYHYEALAVAEAVAAGLTEHPLMPIDESVEIMTLVDRARALWQGTAR